MVLADTYQVTSAFTGEQGIEIVRDENPGLVLLDINLPDINGLKVLKRIMAIPGPPPVVMPPVYSDVKIIVAAIKAAACFRLYNCRLERIIQRYKGRFGHLPSRMHLCTFTTDRTRELGAEAGLKVSCLLEALYHLHRTEWIIP